MLDIKNNKLCGYPIVGDLNLLRNIKAVGITDWDGNLETFKITTFKQFITNNPIDLLEPVDKGGFGFYGFEKIKDEYRVVCGFSFYKGWENEKNEVERNPHFRVKLCEKVSCWNEI